MDELIGIGTGIVECLRIAHMIERHGDLFLNRVFTRAEIQFCQTHAAATQHFASRWAAKEALLKALGIAWRRGIGWRDLEIKNREAGQPTVVLHGQAKQHAQRLGVRTIHVSLAHCRTTATAHVVICGQQRGERAG